MHFLHLYFRGQVNVTQTSNIRLSLWYVHCLAASNICTAWFFVDFVLRFGEEDVREISIVVVVRTLLSPADLLCLIGWSYSVFIFAIVTCVIYYVNYFSHCVHAYLIIYITVFGRFVTQLLTIPNLYPVVLLAIHIHKRHETQFDMLQRYPLFRIPILAHLLLCIHKRHDTHILRMFS